MKEEIITAGFGGQGILFLGQVLAHAAMVEGKEVTWIPSYGPEMRGGTANCMVVISDQRIRSPLVYSPSTAIIFNKPSMDRFEPTVSPGGLLLFNSDLVDRPARRDDLRVIPVPADSLASKVAGRQAANMVMLGAYVGATGTLSIESIEEALEEVTPEHRRSSLETNRAAIELGVRHGKSAGGRE